MFDAISPDSLIHRNWCGFGVKTEHKALLLSINSRQILLAYTGSSSWMELRQIQKQLSIQGIRAAWITTNCPETPPGNHPIWDSGLEILSSPEGLFYEEGPDNKPWLNASKGLPLFQYKPVSTAEEGIIVLGEQKIPLPTFVDSLLDGNIRFCNQATLMGKVKVFFRLFINPCWKCSYRSWIYVIDGYNGINGEDQYLLTPCYQQAEIEWVSWKTTLEFHPQTIDLLQWITSQDFQTYPLSIIKPRYSKMAGQTYLSFGCPACDSLFGAHFIDELRHSPHEETDTNCFWATLDFIKTPLILTEQSHWCYSETDTFCF